MGAERARLGPPSALGRPGRRPGSRHVFAQARAWSPWGDGGTGFWLTASHCLHRPGAHYKRTASWLAPSPILHSQLLPSPLFQRSIPISKKVLRLMLYSFAPTQNGHTVARCRHTMLCPQKIPCFHGLRETGLARPSPDLPLLESPLGGNRILSSRKLGWCVIEHSVCAKEVGHHAESRDDDGAPWATQVPCRLAGLPASEAALAVKGAEVGLPGLHSPSQLLLGVHGVALLRPLPSLTRFCPKQVILAALHGDTGHGSTGGGCSGRVSRRLGRL